MAILGPGLTLARPDVVGRRAADHPIAFASPPAIGVGLDDLRFIVAQSARQASRECRP